MFLSDAPSNSSWSSLDRSDHSSRTWSVLLVNGLFVGCVTIVVSLRILTKFTMAARLFLDDFLMIGSAVVYSVFCILNLYAATIGFGLHLWALPSITDDSTTPEDVAKAAAPVQELNYVALTLVSPAIILAKLSVIAILLRVFPPSMRGLRLFLLGLSAVIVACCLTQALIVVFQCFPVETSWDMTRGGTCYVNNLDDVVMGLGVLNVVTDLVICITPIPYFLKLKLPRLQKLCLCGLFLSGLIACGVSVGRVLSLRGLHDDIDVTYATVPYFNWSSIEVGLIIIAGSVPSLRPFLGTILPEFFREHNFTSLFALSEGSATQQRLGETDDSARGEDPWKSPSLSKGFSSSSFSSFSNNNSNNNNNNNKNGGGLGSITITTEYQIEELRKEPRSAGRPITPCTPLATKFGPRAIVTCESSKGQSPLPW